MKNKIKEFYQDHKETIDSSLMIMCGLGCALSSAIALREMHRADGMRIKDAVVYVHDDLSGGELNILLMNGKTVGGTFKCSAET